jgi:hypothetical protein
MQVVRRPNEFSSHTLRIAKKSEARWDNGAKG